MCPGSPVRGCVVDSMPPRRPPGVSPSIPVQVAAARQFREDRGRSLRLAAACPGSPDGIAAGMVYGCGVEQRL